VPALIIHNFIPDAWLLQASFINIINGGFYVKGKRYPEGDKENLKNP
jgi:hypothetical protein